MRKNRAHFDAMESVDCDLYPYTTACIDAVEEEVKAFWTRPELEDASVVIRNRHTLEKAVKMSADKWMREHR